MGVEFVVYNRPPDTSTIIPSLPTEVKPLHTNHHLFIGASEAFQVNGTYAKRLPPVAKHSLFSAFHSGNKVIFNICRLRPPNWTVCSTNMTIGHINILQKNHIPTDMQESFAIVSFN